MGLAADVRTYLRKARAHRRGAPATFEALAASTGLRPLPMDRVDTLDEPGITAAFRPVVDVTGRRLMERGYAAAAPDSYTPLFDPIARLDAPAVILSGFGWVISWQGWLKPFSYHRGQSFIAPELRIEDPGTAWIRDRTVLGGTTLNAMSDWVQGVYGHTLWESVWRVLAYWDAHRNFDGIDHILAPALTRKLLGRFDPDILAAAGDRFVHPQSFFTAIVCDNVVALPHPLTGGSISAGQVALLNRYALCPETEAPARVLLTRSSGGARGMANLDEVVETVRRFGYVPVSGATTPDIFSLFRQAESVIGVHGSDLADIVFMQSGRHVLEITPTDHVQPFFRDAGARVGLAYQTLFAPSASHRLAAGKRPSNVPVRVDCRALDAALAAAS